MEYSFQPQVVGARRALRVAFLDTSGWDFHALTPESAPLGGSQSALCYLARALAARGNQVYIASEVSVPGLYGGVHSMSMSGLTDRTLAGLNLDACVCVLGMQAGKRVRQAVGPRVPVVFWTQHAPDQSNVQALRVPAERNVYDRFALVSQWQAAAFQQAFGIEAGRISIFRNAVAPGFENLFSGPIGAHKAMPPVLAYTSTPFRGLPLLLDAMPRIRAAVPGVRARIFSSMQVYRHSAEEEQRDFGALYDRCRATPGVEYLGSVGQAELARQMREVAVLAYPNVFPETSCIAVMEAMAAGCQVVTSRLAALPETAMGFAELLEMGKSQADYVERFAQAVIGALRQRAEKPEEVEAHLQRQVAAVNHACNWRLRAQQWEEWLRQMGCGG